MRTIEAIYNLNDYIVRTMDELIEKSRAGDEDAFAELVAQNRAKILQQCLSVLHDQAAAEDITQETFIRAYQHLNEFEERSAFSTWVWRIAHNLTVDYLRKVKKSVEIHEESVEAPLIKNEELEKLLPLLPRKHRQVFELYYIEQLSQKEIAEKLDIPYGTVRSRLHHVRKKLKKFRSKV